MPKERIFRFKRFTASHGRSAIPIGMDGVLVGAWCDVSDARTILDVGTGCGLIALICAQRNPQARISGIDPHAPSVQEAADNFAASPWPDRLTAMESTFDSITDTRFDLIVSNPPFFHDGVDTPARSARLAARHADVFGPLQLITHGATLLTPQGRISLIAPARDEDVLLETAVGAGLKPVRLCHVISRPGTEPIRLLLELVTADSPHQSCERTSLTIHRPDPTANPLDDYTPEYRMLTAPFYLRF